MGKQLEEHYQITERGIWTRVLASHVTLREPLLINYVCTCTCIWYEIMVILPSGYYGRYHGKYRKVYKRKSISIFHSHLL